MHLRTLPFSPSSYTHPASLRMLRQQIHLSRISRLRAVSLRLYPTNIATRLPYTRPFTQKLPPQIIAPQRSRPQLSFLSPSPVDRALLPLSKHLRQHFARLVSTESRTHFKKEASRVLRISLSLIAIVVLSQVIDFGLYVEELEHKWPTPPEWSWLSRWHLRAAEAWQHPVEINKLSTEWPAVADHCRLTLERLEDIKGDGKDIVEQDDGGILVEGVGKTGFDITAKSEPWRRGYFQALMGSAKAAENLDGWLTDRRLNVCAEAKYFVGPSNPRPKPPPRGKKAPREEDSEPASPSPEVFYMKILTTRGFDTRQKLDAALACADWLDYKGLQSTAADMYSWALDIAASGSLVDAAKIIDLKTGIITNDSISAPSENILRVSTALAVHHAQNGNLPRALSIFTSVLQARRALPPPPPGTVLPSPPSLPKRTNNPIMSFLNKLWLVFTPVVYPEHRPSGDKPPFRTEAALCDEAGLMTYIGEIIYASSSKEKGLAWTRDAVEIAESTIFGTTVPSPDNRCAECLRVGLENWRTMISRLVKEADEDEKEINGKSKNGSAWFCPSKKSIEAKADQKKRWEAERLVLDERIKRLRPLIEMELESKPIVPGAGLFG
ncbi:hypothetical protein BJX70DRAFT_233199 [Aspergillus crustosus]